jgi:SP family sugar:H+ symporter-like MFS transporter
MQPPNQARRVNLPTILLISGAAALGGFLFGYDSGVINGAVSALQLAFNTSDVVSGFKVASLLLGCAVGAFFAGPIADRFGRRPALFAAAILFAVSSWATGIASTAVVFILWRLVGGFAVGAVSIISPAYISEIAPAAIRGRLASLQQMAIVLGLFAAFLVNFLLVSASGGASQPFWLGFQTWRWMLWAEIVPSMAFLIALVFIPESPRFLVAANRKSQAEAVLARISHPNDAAAKVAEIQATLAQDRRPRMSDLLVPGIGGVRPIVWAGIALAALQQLVGINVVFYYGEVLWRAAGFSESDALMST